MLNASDENNIICFEHRIIVVEPDVYHKTAADRIRILSHLLTVTASTNHNRTRCSICFIRTTDVK